MPIYEFECPACGDRFDRLQKISDPDPETCPHCGAGGVRRALTAPAFRLAGSGWYETDFKKDGDKKRNLADKGDSGKAESKPAAESSAAKSSDTSAAASPGSSKPSDSSSAGGAKKPKKSANG